MALLTAPRSPLSYGLAAAIDGGRCRQPKRATGAWCSAIAVEASSLTSVSPIRWGSSKLQGPRSEMEDDLVLRSDGLDGFCFAAVFDGHAGVSSVEFLKEELYKECLLALQGGLLLNSMNLNSAKEAIKRAFKRVDSNLLDWLEQTGKDVDSGATATVVLLKNDLLVISHVGDSSVVLSRTGRAEVLTNPHRPYGNNRVCLEEIKRIRAAGGWIIDGRICGDISVSRAFGDIRFKTKKNEMLTKGVEEGKWTEKFASRIMFKGDLITASPDIYDLQLGSDTEFVILASDGLWDYMKSTEAVSFVRDQLRQHGDVQIACEALGRAALQDRYSADNISIVIAELGRTDWQNMPEQRPNIFLEITQAFATLGAVSLGIWLTSFLFL